QVVRQRSAKPLFAGSIPAVASISIPSHFSFEATVESHGWYRLAPFRWSRDERVLRRKEVLDGTLYDLVIDMHRRALRVRGAPDTPELRARITRMFQLNVETAEFIALARNSPAHTWVEQANFGRLLCGATLFEDAVKIILTTNVTWSQTVKMCALLVEKCGNGGAFPSPAEIARFSPDELQRDCRLGYRSKTIHALSTMHIDIDSTAPTPDLYKQYLALPGIGPYGAAHLLAMDGRHDFIAVDTEFRRFVRETYHGGRKVSDKTMLRRYAKWGRWKYLAYWSELWNERG
ncbi:MAG TPA: endonuclease III domain-containing protein, partial [Thermoanaerobaculia bacterium]|nr:endonuclease III domain-containing protein [Thermoanaerobaculia bacterium]